jgi:hypothetical protein
MYSGNGGGRLKPSRSASALSRWQRPAQRLVWLGHDLGPASNIRHGNDNGGGGSVVFDLRGAVMTSDLLNQMNAISARTGGQVYGQIKSEQARAMKAQQYRVAR